MASYSGASNPEFAYLGSARNKGVYTIQGLCIQGLYSIIPYSPPVSLVLLNPTYTLKVCKIMAFMAITMGLGLLFYILLGSR